MINSILELTNSITTSLGFSHHESTIDLLDQLDAIYKNNPIDQLDQKSYKIDKITIKPTELKHVKWNSLSEFNRPEILQFELAKWNLQDVSSIDLKLPKDSTSLSKVTFKFSDNGVLSNKNLKVKDYWPVNGADLAFKLDEGLRIRKLLGLSLDQEIKYVTNKALPALPQTPQFECVFTGDEADIITFEHNDLLYTPSTINGSFDPSPIASSFTSEHEDLQTSSQVNNNLALSQTIYDRNTQEVKILGQRFTMHSEILEDSCEDLLANSTTQSSQTSLVSTIRSLKDSELFYKSSTIVNSPEFQNVNGGSSSQNRDTNSTLLSEID
jgi:hypothetical protein